MTRKYKSSHCDFHDMFNKQNFVRFIFDLEKENLNAVYRYILVVVPTHKNMYMLAWIHNSASLSNWGSRVFYPNPTT